MNIGVLMGDEQMLGSNVFTRNVRRVTHTALNVATKLPVVGSYAQGARIGLSSVQSMLTKTGAAFKPDGLPGPLDGGPKQAGGMGVLIVGAVIIGALVMGGKK